MSDWSAIFTGLAAYQVAPEDGYSRRAMRLYRKKTTYGCWVAFAAMCVLFITGESLSVGRNPLAPYVLIAGVAAGIAWPVMMVTYLIGRNRMVKRKRSGRCLKCGYPRPRQESGICTECGTTPWWDDHELSKA